MEKENKPTKKELIDILDELILAAERLPPPAMVMPVTHYDHWQLMILLSQILKQDQAQSES